MTGKRCILLAFSLLAAAGLGGGAVFWSLFQVPDFYQKALAEQSDPVARQEAAQRFVERTVRLVDDIKYSDTWSQEFTDQQVNAWLAEELHRKYAELVPEGVRDPRVRIEGDKILLGFRYEHESWSGVVSLRLRPWVPEPNQLAIEIESIRAGLMPIPLGNVLDELSEQIESDGWRAEWTEVNGNDVLLVHFDDGTQDQPVLEAVEVAGNAVRISGSRSAQRVVGSDSPGESALNVPRLAVQSGEK